MAFKQNTAANTAAVQPSADSWKAQGFLNLYLPSKNGSRRKLGSIPLKEARPSEATLLAWLNEDPSRVATILERLEMDYQPASGRDDNGFDLPE